MGNRNFALFLAFTFAGCSSDPENLPTPDSGGVDATQPDGGVPYDGGPPPPDGGPIDAGFSDPATLLQGLEYIGGVRIYIHLRGTLTSTMPPVIFLNTGPSLGNEYLLLPMEFLLGPGGPDDPDRLLVFFDLRTTGRSGFGTLGSTTAVDVNAHLTDVQNVIDFIDERVDASRVDFVGHGYGTAVAALYAAANPNRVSRLVLTSPYPANIHQHAQYHAEISARLSSSDRERFLEITRQPDCWGNIPLCSLELWDIIGPRLFCEDNLHLYETLNIEYADFRAGYGFIDFELRESSYDWGPSLGRVQTPTTIISGPCDPTPPETPLTYTASITGSRHVVIPNTGHFPMVEDPTTYQSIVKEALTYP